MALSWGLSLCCIQYVFILKLILEVFCLIILLNKAKLSWNIIRMSQRTSLNRDSEFCGSDSRGFAECSSSTDNQQKLDSRFGITLVLDESAGFHCSPTQGIRTKGQGTHRELLSPAIVGQSKVHCLSWETQNLHTILYLHSFSSFSVQYL